MDTRDGKIVYQFPIGADAHKNLAAGISGGIGNIDKGLTEADVAGRDFYFGEGCMDCNNTGYKGRKGIYEYLRVTNAVKELINERKPTLMIRDKAVEQGMRTMRQDGVRNILDGYVTVEEVVKYT